MSAGRGWYSRGYLPHFDSEGRTQFLTWRQDDAVPLSVIEKWREELKFEKQEESKRKIQSRIEEYCDAGYGSCVLKNHDAARAMATILHLHREGLYELHHWVIMSNHVHILLTPMPTVSLEKIIHQLKGQSAREINKVAGRTGRLWDVEAFDRYIRNQEHFDRVARYIERNPVKANLCSKPEEWPWSSASI